VTVKFRRLAGSAGNRNLQVGSIAGRVHGFNDEFVWHQQSRVSGIEDDAVVFVPPNQACED